MNDMLHVLAELNTLYHTDTLEVYELRYQEVVQRIETLFPGFTLAYAELYNAGADRYAHGGMRHVLAPKEGGER